MAQAQLAQAPQAVANARNLEVKRVVPVSFMERQLVAQLLDLGRRIRRQQIDVAQPLGPALAQLAADTGRVDELQPDGGGAFIDGSDRLLGREVGDGGGSGSGSGTMLGSLTQAAVAHPRMCRTGSSPRIVWANSLESTRRFTADSTNLPGAPLPNFVIHGSTRLRQVL